MISNIAQKLQDNLHYKQQVVIDPATIMLIISITTTVIKAIKKCKEKPEEALMLAKFPSKREQKLLRRNLRQGLGWVKYWKEGDLYYKAALETGQTITLQEIIDGYGELDKGK